MQAVARLQAKLAGLPLPHHGASLQLLFIHKDHPEILIKNLRMFQHDVLEMVPEQPTAAVSHTLVPEEGEGPCQGLGTVHVGKESLMRRSRCVLLSAQCATVIMDSPQIVAGLIEHIKGVDAFPGDLRHWPAGLKVEQVGLAARIELGLQVHGHCS